MRRLLALLPFAVLGAIAVPVIASAGAAAAIAVPAMCLPAVATATPGATGEGMPTSPGTDAIAATATTAEGAPLAANTAAQDAAEPTMERAIDRAFVAGVVGQPAGKPLAGAELETRTHEVGLLLRCPVCQGSSVADSPSSTAINMKNEVRDLLAQGYDQHQILAWFEASYGQFVLMQPKAEGLNLLVWVGPGVLLLAGLGLVAWQVRRSMRGPQATAPEAEGEPVDPELEGYLQQARALAFGSTDTVAHDTENRASSRAGNDPRGSDTEKA